MNVDMESESLPPLHDAVKRGDVLEATRLLASGAAVNAFAPVGDDDVAPLHIAAANDSVTLAQLLLEHHADVNCATLMLGSTALTTAAGVC